MAEGGDEEKREETKGVMNLKGVAERAGVSSSTVSRVLSGKSYVNEQTRAKVLEAIKDLNYTPNVLAQGLKLGRTSTIALIVPSIHNEIFPVITRGVEDVARKLGYTVILCNTDDDVEIEKDYINKLRTRYIDGFIVASALPGTDHLHRLKKDGVPVVLLSRCYDDAFDAVVIDNYRAAYEGVGFLLRSGHRRIAIACGPRELSIYEQRFRGYADALRDAGIEVDPDLVMMEVNGTTSFYYLTQGMLRRGAAPDAVFATSDPKAIVIMRAIKDAGLSVPGDVSVLGFDNIEMSAFVEPPLSTISQPLYEMGALGARKLIELITGEEKAPRTDILGTDLIVRKSTR